MAEREEEEKSRGFKVEDRRRFSAEGELKPEHQGEQPQSEPPPRESQPSASAQSGRAQAAVRSAPEAGRHPDSGPEINFTTFVVSLSTQALMHLGEIPDPVSNQREQDLAAAQHMIDILGMLQNKTRGNLDSDEEGLLRSILFDLRMKYVETARH
jgi:hypothetical protein